MQHLHGHRMGPARDFSVCSIPYEFCTGLMQDNQNLQMRHFWYQNLGSIAQCIICLPYRGMIFVVHDIIIIKAEKIKHKRPNGLTSSPATLTRGPEMGLLVHPIALHWRHNDHNGVSNHQPRGCLLNRLFGRRSRKTSNLCVTGLCAGNKMFPFDDVIMEIHLRVH